MHTLYRKGDLWDVLSCPSGSLREAYPVVVQLPLHDAMAIVSYLNGSGNAKDIPDDMTDNLPSRSGWSTIETGATRPQQEK